MRKSGLEIIKEGVCYVLPQVGTYHPIAEFHHGLIWYPERAMSLYDTVKYRRYEKSVVTENPYLISCYPREDVRIWDEKRGWVEPENQTYGQSVNSVEFSLLGVRQTIPSTVYDGGTEIDKHIEKLEKIYKKAQKLKMIGKDR